MGSITPLEAAQDVSSESVDRPLGPPAIDKPNGWQLYERMGRPKFVVAVGLVVILSNMREQLAKIDSAFV